MKKLVLFVGIVFSSLSFANINHGASPVSATKNLKNGIVITKKSELANIKKQLHDFRHAKYEFPVTFCDDSGCDTYSYSGSMSDLMNYINCWLSQP